MCNTKNFAGAVSTRNFAKKFRGMKNQKSELLTIRLTADQKKAIREAAGQHGCTVSELVRSLAQTTVNKAA